MEDRQRYAKSEYGRECEQDKPTERKSTELKPSIIAYGLVLRTTLEDLPSLKRDLEQCFERHQVIIIAQRPSLAFLTLVEEQPWLREQREEELARRNGHHEEG